MTTRNATETTRRVVIGGATLATVDADLHIADPVIQLYQHWRALVERYDAFDCDTDEDGTAEESARHAVLKQRDVIYERLTEMPARTLAGAVAKLRALGVDGNLCDHDERVINVVIADLERLAQEMPPPAA